MKLTDKELIYFYEMCRIVVSIVLNTRRIIIERRINENFVGDVINFKG